ncbi:MFS general substrate transporter [Cadophora sp. DSE1049]|nr:MFS general substrate transporter [Cadophora sp. DSE1049]
MSNPASDDKVTAPEVQPSDTQSQKGDEKLIVTENADKAAGFLLHTEGYAELTPEAEKRLKRKIDWFMIPMLFLVATLGAVDKVALGTSALYGLRTDNHLVGQQYSWLGSILSLGAIVGMPLSSYLIQRLPRAFEAIIVPGISLIIAGFYTKEEQPPRNALVFAAASSVINGFLSWAIGHIPTTAPLHIWQYLFLLTGSISMLWSIIAFIFLPNDPMNAIFLSKEQKYQAVQRLAKNKTGIVNKKFKMDQAKEAFLDPKTWILFFFNIAINIPNGGLTTFGGLIISGLGFSGVDASLLTMPSGVMSTLASFIFSLIAAKWHNRRCLVTIIACCIPIIGSIVVYSLPRTNLGGQMVGLYLLYTYFGPYVVGISLAQANTAGHTKKTVVFAILYIGYAVGNLIGPQTFRASQAPEYIGGFTAMIVCYCVCIGLMGLYWALAARQNKRIDALVAEANKTMHRRQSANRRRTGCWTCKSAINSKSEDHTKCTEEHPRCARCLKLGLDCEYGLRLLWKEDAAQRNICLGREGKWRKMGSKDQTSRSDPGKSYEPIDLGSYIGEWIFLNFTGTDFCQSQSTDTQGDVEDISTADGDKIPISNESLILMPSNARSIALNSGIFGGQLSLVSPGHFATSTLSSIDGNLFSYFVLSICPSCSLSPSQNPYLAYLTPMSFEFPVLRSALLAVSANQIRLLGDRRFERDAWSHKSRAIRGVQEAIDDGVVDVGIVATILMLCFYDISDGCNPSWVTHLRGGMVLLDQVSNSESSQTRDGNLLSFLRMYFVAHDIMSRTACDEDIVNHSYQWTEDTDIDEIDVLMGCSRRLMNLVREISALAGLAKTVLEKERNSPHDIATLTASRDFVEQSLQTLEQALPAGIALSSNLPQIAETKRLAALLYLKDRLDMLPPTCNLPSIEASNSGELITSIIALIRDLPDSPTLLWPLYILGTTGTGLDEEQRRFVHNRLTALQKVRNLGSVRRARLAVEQAWMRMDVDLEGGERRNRRSGHLISLA